MKSYKPANHPENSDSLSLQEIRAIPISRTGQQAKFHQTSIRNQPGLKQTNWKSDLTSQTKKSSRRQWSRIHDPQTGTIDVPTI